MTVFTLLYAVLAVVEVKLLLKYVRSRRPSFDEAVPPTGSTGRARSSFAY